MKHQDGYCDACGCETAEQWLTLDGRSSCAECARGELETAVRVATRPEARDDGR